ncbi:MAG: mechanosensitive ion channel family protein [Cytophagales bacterium]|nr:mechanosensitive ion channel family protein [Cytophagales bacterium]
MIESIVQFWKNIGRFEILGNDLHNIVLAGIILFFALVLNRYISDIASRVIYRVFKNASSRVTAIEFVKLLIKPMQFFLIMVFVYVAFDLLEWPEMWHLKPIKKFGLKLIVLRTYQTIFFGAIYWVLLGLADFFALELQKKAQEEDSKLQEQLVPFINQLAKMVLFVILFFVMLGVVYKLNVGAIITGLGIGGVAVALAGKETLENLLASFTIFIDKPFISGDLIKVSGIVGNVETVGFRTTRIRTLDRSLMTLPNKQLIDSPLENLTTRKYHRAYFKIGLPFGTSADAIKHVIQQIENTLAKNPKTNSQVHVHFDGFGDYTLDVIVIYNAKAVEFEDFWKIKEEINYKIIEIMQKSGTDIEYPTQIVYVKSLDDKKATSLPVPPPATIS